MHDSEKSKFARFVSGLRREIQDIVELYDYSSLEKLVHLAIKVESQVLKKTFLKNTHNDDFYKCSWRTKKKFKPKLFLPISQKKPLHKIKFLKITLPLLCHPPKPQI